ncbi:hypothetical protein F2Q65_13570 [Thiohalocapsa marina]|uniref:Uncharacterized protein n=1 Tax=Thiohalocapsa marina TaxID=424902 RepID=A0A5M8FK40_9GAMM|nr:hypothetical protein [Thiohalocapsa marina]KAA6184096.1 hypothetical protein F2Q65_13570 [Thiohalocapsa marina]
MRTLPFGLLLGTLLAATPAAVLSGNKALMEANAQALIEINEAVLEQLQVGDQDGQYRLLARVVEREGERVIRVERLERSDVAAEPILSPIPAPTLAPAPVPTPVPTSSPALAPAAPVLDPDPDPASAAVPVSSSAPSGGATVRYGPIPDYSSGAFHNGTGRGVRAAALPIPDSVGEQRRLQVLFDAHPDLQLIELTPEEIRQIPKAGAIAPGGGAALLFW